VEYLDQLHDWDCVGQANNFEIKDQPRVILNLKKTVELLQLNAHADECFLLIDSSCLVCDAVYWLRSSRRLELR
jgi:hypothetical protein